MSLPTSEPINPPEEQIPPARRRKQRRQLLPGMHDGYAQRLEELGQRATPGVEFFLSALLSGMLFGVALLIDAPALAILALLFSPFAGPVCGLALASLAGSPGYFLRALASLAAGGLIYLLTGSLAGWLAQLLPPAGLTQAMAHLQLTWPGLLLLLAGSILTTYLLTRTTQQRSMTSSLAVAYTIFLPLGAAGFALTSGLGLDWLAGLAVFAAHLALACLSGMLTFAILGLRPRNLLSYLFLLAYLLAVAGLLLPLANLPLRLPAIALPKLPALSALPQLPVLRAPAGEIATPTQPAATTLRQNPATLTPSPAATLSPRAATRTPAASQTATPQPASATPPAPDGNPTSTPTRTLVPSPTYTETVTPMPTPVWARINAKDGDGAYIRANPSYDSEVVQVLLNGLLIQVLPDVAIVDGATWVKVRTANGKEGWIVRSLLATATPAPGW